MLNTAHDVKFFFAARMLNTAYVVKFFFAARTPNTAHIVKFLRCAHAEHGPRCQIFLRACGAVHRGTVGSWRVQYMPDAATWRRVRCVSNTCPIPLPSSVLVAADQQLRVVTHALGCPRAGASGDGHADNSLDGHANPLTRARRPRPRRRPDPADSELDGHADER